ncbi:MAG: sirohydrochlorin chelatase [Candidatus Thorarchaeota archaeon]
MIRITTIVVLAMHGVPPNDFPTGELTELFRLHGQLQHIPPHADPYLQQRHDELDVKIRNWPRNESNDPYWGASYILGKTIESLTNWKVIVGFNEFCAPSIDDAMEEAILQSPKRIIVVTPMMTAGGEHSEVDIPDAIARARHKHADIEIVYAWPFKTEEIAKFLVKQIEKHLRKAG